MSRSRTSHYPPPVKKIKPPDYLHLIKAAIAEDHIKKDASTYAIFTRPQKCKAYILAKDNGILCGQQVAQTVFKTVDKKIKIALNKKDGARLKPGIKVMQIEGNIQSVLTAERIALNFLSFLSGISTRAHRISSKLKPMGVKLLDTRKTLPGYRVLSKYAVHTGGGYNHRLHLAQLGMIKDNHITQAGSIENAIRLFRKKYPRQKVEVEVETFSQLKKVITSQPEIILLDNMTGSQLKKCAAFIKEYNRKNKTTITSEASGGFTEQNLQKLQGTGVDYVSMGSLTNTVKPFDFSLEVFA